MSTPNIRLAILSDITSSKDLCINTNNHQNTIFHQFENCLKTPLALLGVDLKNSKINKICHFTNHPYLSAKEATHYKGL